MIIFGVIMMIFTFSSILAIDYLFGIVLIILGIQLLTSGSTFLGEYKRTWWVILLGILAIIFGIVAFVFPAMITLYIVYMIAITSLISGFTDLAICHLRQMRSGKPCPRRNIRYSRGHSWYPVHHFSVRRSIRHCSGNRNLPACIRYPRNRRRIHGKKGCSGSVIRKGTSHFFSGIHIPNLLSVIVP